MRVGSLFSGIGGLELGLERAGMQVVWQVENDPYAVRVLENHWPDVLRHDDVFSFDPAEFPEVDLICGGFPCQPVSLAGRQKGDTDERWLWGEFARIVREVGPRWVLAENVPGLLSASSGQLMGVVVRDLAACGYCVQWDCIPAAAVGAPHLRDRVFILAHSGGARNFRRCGERNGQNQAGPCRQSVGSGANTADVAHADQQGPQGRHGEVLRECPREWSAGQGGTSGAADFWVAEPDVGQLVNGIPFGLAGGGINADARWVQIPCQEDAESCLRKLRIKFSSLRSPHQWGLDEQCTFKLADALQFMSHLSASQTGRHCDKEAQVEMQALRHNLVSAGLMQHASDQIEAVWESLAEADKVWVVMASCVGVDWQSVPVGRVAKGVPNRIHRLRCLGNAVVPQVAEYIGRQIMNCEQGD